MSQQGHASCSILTLGPEGAFYFSNPLLLHPRGSQYSASPQLIAFHDCRVVLVVEC